MVLTKMPVVRYLDQNLSEPAELVAAVRQRRGGRLMNLDRVLLHSPVFTEGWGAFMGRVRGQLDLDPFLLELAMVVPAILLKADYEVHHHGAGLKRVGASSAQIAALTDMAQSPIDDDLFTAGQVAVIRLATEMTLQGVATRETLAAAAKTVDGDKGLVELVGVISAYNMVSRIITTLDIRPESETGWD